MKSSLSVAALALIAAVATLVLPKLRDAQPPAPKLTDIAAATPTPTPTVGAAVTAEPVFVRPGEVAPPPGSPTPEPERAEHVAATPEQAVREYVQLAGNWTSSTVVANYRKLATRTVGDARVHAQTMVARVPIDKTYTTRKPVLETELAGVVRRGGQNDTPTYLAIVRQRLTIKGAPKPSETPAWQIATATLEQAPGGWVLTDWKDPR
ncbi:hypothetical protein C8N24_0308 [Solirubrobacter pauli]|uniref:Mce-associated membrane protein n=1 Tax=Solirubrobacter pauli TaxID=166793 RepID=A0A660L9C1_9ACTN|nr:hypothetical protein [Solirubrobacter pauli]RKQ90503.1 hypothetical protein C8N24_0308 [Solirubrobacter pauli]